MGDFIPCSVCGQPANVHLTQINSNEVTKVHFCEACAAKQEVAGGALAPIAHAISMLQKKIQEESEKNEKGKKSGGDDHGEGCDDASCPACAATAAKTCPRCGLTGSEFLKSRRLGCAGCYKTFSEEINALLPKIQPGQEHEGHIPGGTALVNAIKERVAKAREDMAVAVKSENYEEAARLRDEILRLETATTDLAATAAPAKKTTDANASGGSSAKAKGGVPPAAKS